MSADVAELFSLKAHRDDQTMKNMWMAIMVS